jgi:CO dehydrogenase/acetyl-CoA synthase alpha subunit
MSENKLKPLRKCIYCGLEAHTEKDLELFVANKPSLYGRNNICKKCNKPLQEKHNRESNPKRIKFHRSGLIAGDNPRTNTCSLCGRSYPKDLKIQTSIHHAKYDFEKPLSDTVEVCQSCHVKLHWKEGIMGRIGNCLRVK